MLVNGARLLWIAWRLAGVLLLALGCQSGFGGEPFVRVQMRSSLEERPPIQRVAVAPFAVASSWQDGVGPDAEDASRLVARYVAEAMEEQGVDLIPADDVRRATAAEGSDLAPGELARLVAERLGADALVTGSVSRFQERSGQAGGSVRPASVGFEVTLFGAPDGEPLWRALFDETQMPWSENVLRTSRYPGRGTRWLSAEELARWGAGELALAIPVGASWRSK
ncbi:MAG: hypothetical protein ABFS46_06580 [Myxococcota bacterium]